MAADQGRILLRREQRAVHGSQRDLSHTHAGPMEARRVGMRPIMTLKLSALACHSEEMEWSLAVFNLVITCVKETKDKRHEVVDLDSRRRADVIFT